MIETPENGYSSESTQQGLSNEYQHDRVLMVFKNLCVLVLWTKETSALDSLRVVISSYEFLAIVVDDGQVTFSVNHLQNEVILNLKKNYEIQLDCRKEFRNFITFSATLQYVVTRQL